MTALRPLRVAGLGTLLGLGLAYPFAHHYVTVGAPGRVAAAAGPVGGRASVAVLPDPSTSPAASASGASGPRPAAGGAATRSSAPVPASPKAKPQPSSQVSTPAPAAAPVSRTLAATGPTVWTPYGPVQVRATVRVSPTSWHLLGVTELRLPSGGRSGDISAYAGPALVRESLSGQGAQVDTVSGASYTSDGYRRSLQAALDAARRAATP